MDKASNLFVYGLWSDKEKDETRGHFVMKVDAMSFKILNTEINEFSPKVLEDAGVSKNNIAKGRGIEHLRIDSRGFTADGGLIIFCENYESSVSLNSGNPRRSYLEIYVIKYSKDVKQEWVNQIFKRQYATEDGFSYMSFGKQVVGNKVYLIYNDNKNVGKTFEKDKVQDLRIYSSSHTMMVTIEPDGTMKKKMIADNDPMPATVTPEIIYPMSDNKLILPAQSLKSYSRFGFLELE